MRKVHVVYRVAHNKDIFRRDVPLRRGARNDAPIRLYTSGAVTGGTGSGDAVVNGGGVCLSGDSPQFTMRGGAISGNTALAAFSYGGGWCEAFAG